MVQKEEIESYILNNYMYRTDGTLVRGKTYGRWREGLEVGSCVGKRGYKTISILGRRFYTHQIIYWCHTGEWPLLIDHIDGVKTNNSPSNLRASSKTDNALNLFSCHKDNKSGFLGVTYQKKSGKYYARFRGKHIGSFTTGEEAHKAYVNFKRDATVA
tara:strand:+ start:96 stop:569 length:474 start_codon:yes stop_codon:yes gene_type:complete